MFWSIFMIVFIFTHETDEGKFPVNMKLLCQTLNPSILCKHHFNLLVCKVFWVVFHIEVICVFSDIAAVFGFVGDGDALFFIR